MELAFANKVIRKICEDDTYARRKLGNEVAECLQNRLADLQTVTTVMDLIVGNPTEIDTEYKLDLSDKYYLVFCSNHTEIPYKKDGKINWAKVTRVKIIQINLNT